MLIFNSTQNAVDTKMQRQLAATVFLARKARILTVEASVKSSYQHNVTRNSKLRWSQALQQTVGGLATAPNPLSISSHIDTTLEEPCAESLHCEHSILTPQSTQQPRREAIRRSIQAHGPKSLSLVTLTQAHTAADQKP